MIHYPITKFEKWILRRIFKRIVVQSEFHMLNIIEVNKIMREEVQIQFSEDNTFTTDDFLLDCLDATQHKPRSYYAK